MARTYRKSEHVTFKEGNPLNRTDIHYRCRCSWCTTDKKELQEKIAERELREFLR